MYRRLYLYGSRIHVHIFRRYIGVITARNLAQKLNLSPSAVSLALNGRQGVSESTRQRVLEEARRAGYTGTRGRHDELSKEESPRVIRYVIFLESGMAVSETSFYSIVLQGIEPKAKELGFNVLVSYFNAQEDWISQLEVLEKDVSGVILLATEVRDEHIRKFMNLNRQHTDLPACFVDNATSLIDIDSVVSDNLRGAHMATSYLLNKGFSDVGYLRSKTRIDNFDEREAGVRKARCEYGIPDCRSLSTISVSSSSEQAYQDMCDALSNGIKPERAYFADNDIIAAACIRALKSHGYRVPEDVSVIGFDDMPLSTLFEPPLTTIRVEKELLGKVAMKLLGMRIEQHESLFGEHKPAAAFRVTVSARMIERGSVMR